jgi:hypothetical protein
MDEGLLMSEDDGKTWRQMWPLKYDPEVSGHYERVAVNDINGIERIIATCYPWGGGPNRVVLSNDGGRTFATRTSGLPDYLPRANTMWGTGYARALAVDPVDPRRVYLGIDGDPEDGKTGGGAFKSEDGGQTWKQLPHQPGSRRVFFGLAVDPTHSRRLYWGGCGDGGGLYRSEDGGETWQLVFDGEKWIFNVLVTAAGVVYCPGNQLWRSSDHGKTWEQISHFEPARQIVGLEADPRDSRTLWISTVSWDGTANGGVYETRDGGATWQDISNPLYRAPLILRFNPATNELWAGGAGLFKLKR